MDTFTLPARIQESRLAMLRARAELSDYLRYCRSQKPRFYGWDELNRLSDSVAVTTSDYLRLVASEVTGPGLEQAARRDWSE
jgi:hypothetical protein